MKKFAFVALFAACAFAGEWKGTISDSKVWRRSRRMPPKSP